MPSYLYSNSTTPATDEWDHIPTGGKILLILIIGLAVPVVAIGLSPANVIHLVRMVSARYRTPTPEFPKIARNNWPINPTRTLEQEEPAYGRFQSPGIPDAPYDLLARYGWHLGGNHYDGHNHLIHPPLPLGQRHIDQIYDPEEDEASDVILGLGREHTVWQPWGAYPWLHQEL
ncbi:hypothetical protein RSAG8_09612, partial [Rhizoctonia solani AG-8 WAC10335]